MKAIPTLLFSCILSALAISCNLEDGTGGMVCTEEFVTHYIIVLEPNGTPADSVDINVRNKDSGQPYDLCQDNYICSNARHTGQYVIFHDGLRDEISDEKEEVIVEGTRENLGFSEEFSFFDDGCHVRKTAGPDTVYLQQDK